MRTNTKTSQSALASAAVSALARQIGLVCLLVSLLLTATSSLAASIRRRLADPTIKVFRKGKEEDYDGPRYTKGIVSHIKKELGITAAAVPRLKTADDAASLVSSTGGRALVGVFREPVSASTMFKVFSEVASEASTYVSEPISAGYSASYKDDPVAAAYGVKAVPAVLLFTPGEAEPKRMPIPRKRDEFTEDALIEWVQKASK